LIVHACTVDNFARSVPSCTVNQGHYSFSLEKQIIHWGS